MMCLTSSQGVVFSLAEAIVLRVIGIGGGIQSSRIPDSVTSLYQERYAIVGSEADDGGWRDIMVANDGLFALHMGWGT